MLLFDETAFAASQELLKGFGPAGRPMVVGAPFPCHLQDIGAEIKELATQAMTVCVKRCDSNEAVWGVMMIPRVPKTAKAGNQSSMLDLIGQVLAASVVANHDMPPLCLAADGHASHWRIFAILSGLENPASLPSSVPFWS